MDIKIIQQDILTLNNRKYYILELNCDLYYTAPCYYSKQVEIDGEIFDYHWVHAQTKGKIRWIISIATEKEYHFEGKNIYFIPDNKIEELKQIERIQRISKLSKCPNCNSDLIQEIESSTLTIICINCDWYVTSSHIDHINDTKYKIILEKGNLPSKKNIKTISQVMNYNFLQAQKVIESDCPIIVEDTVSGIIEQIEKLDKTNIKYSITPNFPYNKE